MGFKSIIKALLKRVTVNRKKKYFFKQQANTYCLSKKAIKKANKLGFTADEYVIYNLDVNSPDDYISEFERMLYREAVIYYRILLDNKIVFYNLIRNFASVNKIYAYKEHGIYVALEEKFEEQNVIDRLKERRKLVYKKNNEGGGEGFKLLEFDGTSFYINRNNCDEKDILNLIDEDNYLIEEFCEQSDFENQLYPYSVNTLRLITIETSNKEYKVVAAFQRMGMDKEKCVDNVCGGGLYSLIDLETGVLSAARSRATDRLRDSKGGVFEYTRHPETGSQLEGIAIPRWKEIVEQTEVLHKKLCYTRIPFIAWDVALTNEGTKIIEANTSCGMRLLQTFHGVRNQTIGNWMKEKGYIK